MISALPQACTEISAVGDGVLALLVGAAWFLALFVLCVDACQPRVAHLALATAMAFVFGAWMAACAPRPAAAETITHQVIDCGKSPELCTAAIASPKPNRKPRDEHCWDVNCRCVTESGGECCSMAGCLVVHVDESIVCDRFCTRGRLEKR